MVQCHTVAGSPDRHSRDGAGPQPAAERGGVRPAGGAPEGGLHFPVAKLPEEAAASS